jgi:hypothetical protein
MKKTYIVIPYKNTNEKYKKALDLFIEPYYEYVKSQLSNFEIMIIEQLNGSINTNLPEYYTNIINDNNREFFNLGRTINIGYDIVKDKINDEDIYFFQALDLLPNDVNYNIIKTTKFFESRFPSEGYHHYKLIAFKSEDFKKVNGFSNQYWGWGREDDDMIFRLDYCGVECDKVGYSYERLCNDGISEPILQSIFEFNSVFLNNLQTTRNIYMSGLNNLSYEICSSTDINQHIKKYTVI